MSCVPLHSKERYSSYCSLERHKASLTERGVFAWNVLGKITRGKQCSGRSA